MGSSGWRVPPGSSCSFRSVDVRIVSGRKRERDRRTGRKEPPFRLTPLSNMETESG